MRITIQQDQASAPKYEGDAVPEHPAISIAREGSDFATSR
jgi:hypothetical protein